MVELHGVFAPPGENPVIEVHLDIMEAPEAFLRRLSAFGLENDPFLDFFPPEYCFHYTGRTRIARSAMARDLPAVYALVDSVLDYARQSDVRMYAECELVRKIEHFAPDGDRTLAALDGVQFIESQGEGVRAEADIHVEFHSGTVPPDLRVRLQESGFYWVRTLPSLHFPSEEIATVQMSGFSQASTVFDRLVAMPLPACTGIHLEQKLGMNRSHPDIPLPPVMNMDTTNRRISA